MNKQRQQSAADSAAHRRPEDNSQNGAGDVSQGSGGRGWHGNPQGHAAAGSKGGQKVSQDKEHMASIGRKGGQSVSRDRQHMAEIGRKGGQSRGEGGGEHADDRKDAAR
jgi:general stress protein YciG